jgi:phenylalanyl-tRNA synthetase beta chain
VDGDTIDFEITANRPDCLSVYGLAREASAAFDLDLKPIDTKGPEPKGHAAVPVSVGDAGCGRYALAVADVRIGPSPAWLADRLLSAGVRPINNVVDVTNYVMLEMGQPLHAFDVSRLGGPEIRVRRARAGESLVTLDGVTRKLDETMLVIADKDRPIAVAGVMGGAATEVSSSTNKIALESAWFLPSSVRATSRKLGLKTEASARFERGADPTAPARALRRALLLLDLIEAGTPSGGVSDVYPRPAQPRIVPLARGHVTRLLGDTVPDHDVNRILKRLGFTVAPAADGWQVTVPAFRVDVTREADLIEDVGRHWGFDRIPATFPTLDTVPRPMSPAVARDRRLRGILCGAGLQETCTFSFLERQAAEPFLPAGVEPVAIANPLSEKFAVLRPSLLPGLLDALVYSRRRETDDVRLFEAGAIFLPGGEANRVGWMLTGARAVHWGGSAGDLDVFDSKGIAELIGEAFGVRLTALPTAALPWYVPGRAAELAIGGDGAPAIVVGHVGELLPAIVAERGLTQGTVVAGELDHVAVESHAPGLAHAIEPLPRFPSIVRDLSIFVSDRLPAADVRGTIRSSAPRTLVSVREFDRYQGKGVPEGSTSLSLRLTFRDAERTLTDAEVQKAVDAIVGALVAGHGAVLRGKAE